MVSLLWYDQNYFYFYSKIKLNVENRLSKPAEDDGQLLRFIMIDVKAISIVLFHSFLIEKLQTFLGPLKMIFSHRKIVTALTPNLTSPNKDLTSRDLDSVKKDKFDLTKQLFIYVSCI